MQPVIAISIGDFNGIGPEVILKSCVRSEIFESCRPVVFGPPDALRWHHARLGVALELETLERPDQAREGVLSIVPTEGAFDEHDLGAPTVASGAASIAAIEGAFGAVADRTAIGMVTAPISKAAIASAGSPFRGHTEMLASLCRCTDDVIMIMSSNTMNIGLVTIHIPLKDVAGAITFDRVLRTLRAAHRAMAADFGVTNPRIAVLALNPHASDGGNLGREEVDVIVPAVEAARAESLPVEGPFPADGFFSAHNKQFYDIIVAMYHDQGLIPFKMQARARGVNVSGGLPIVRTSPDHGTAFNIAGRGMADPESMKEAIRLARTIAMNRLRAARE